MSMMSSSAAVAWLVGCAIALCWAPASTSALGAADVAVFAPGRRLLYDVDSGTLLNEAGRSSGEVGLRLRAQMTVAVLWPPVSAAPPHDDFLLHFEVSEWLVCAGFGRMLWINYFIHSYYYRLPKL